MDLTLSTAFSRSFIQPQSTSLEVLKSHALPLIPPHFPSWSALRLFLTQTAPLVQRLQSQSHPTPEETVFLSQYHTLERYTEFERFEQFMSVHPIHLPFGDTPTVMLFLFQQYQTMIPYVVHPPLKHWISSCQSIWQDLQLSWKSLCQKLTVSELETVLPSWSVDTQCYFLQHLTLCEVFVSPHVMTYGLQRYQSLTSSTLSQFGSYQLDDQQSQASQTTSPHTLVLAGAGSGKTLTLMARIQHLLTTQGVSPHEILALSFTAQSAEELKGKLQRQLGVDIEVKTFHKLGLDLLTQVYGYIPTVVPETRLFEVIDHFLSERVFTSTEWMNQLVRFFAYYVKGTSDMTKPSARLQQRYRHRTLRGEFVKSLEELQLANFFYVHQIPYEYERPYEIETKDLTHRQYCPDFYLPEVQLYLEHFGIDEQGHVPWLNEIESQRYQEGMEWKRQLHHHHHTTLMETYSYQMKQANFFEQFAQQLQTYGVSLTPRSPQGLLKELRQQSYPLYAQFSQLMAQFLSLYKALDSTSASLESWLVAQPMTFEAQRQHCFYQLALPIFQTYQQGLAQRQELDFEDMIQQATQQLSRLTLPYRYVLVDEYQDISMSRFQLLKALQQHTQAQLFVVGDDWQSIFRFAGSRVNLFQTFESMFPHTKVYTLEQTYRNSQELLDIASDFMMKNPSQSSKHLISSSHVKHPIRLYSYDTDKKATVVQLLDQLVAEFGPNESIFLLGRYGHDLESVQSLFVVQSTSEGMVLSYPKYPNLRLQFLTIHKAKGLECDHVVLLNNELGPLGFPSLLSDDPLLTPLLGEKEFYLLAEERRLMYVAMTRAKKTCLLVTPTSNPSYFIRELLENPKVLTMKPTGSPLLNWQQPDSPRTVVNPFKLSRCPHIQTNRLANKST